MNNYFSIIIFISLFFIGCDEEQDSVLPTIEPTLPEPSYKLNLQSNSGEKLNSVTISWNKTGDNITLTNLSTNGIKHESEGISLYTGLTPENYYDIEVRANKDGTIYTETIQIFTRSVYPITNFRFDTVEVMRGNGIFDAGESLTDLNDNDAWDEGEEFIDELNEKKYHRKLIWSPTLESQENFVQYIVNRSNDPSQLINPEICNCEISTLPLSLSDSTYIDSSSEVIDESAIAAFYYMVQVSAGGFTQNSFIYNYTSFIQPGPIQLTEGNVSTNNNEFIKITWISPSNYLENFYQYEIWRAPDVGLTNTSLVAIIPNTAIEHFQDRNVGNGTTWYYSVAVVDINGGKKFSNFISGWSTP